MSQPYGPPTYGPQYGPQGPQFRPPVPTSGPYAYPAPVPTSQPTQQPAPYAGPYPYALQAVRVPQPLPRPGVVTMAATMTVLASLQWICVLSFAWLLATAGAASLESQQAGPDSALFHLLNRFNYRMLNGLVWPLYLFPLAAFFLGFMVLAPRVWTRWALTVTGLTALAWSAWWLRADFVWWLPSGAYILVVCLVLWTPGATAWYRARGRPV